MLSVDKFDSKSAGFTLVELAIVMTIIGLLIGGILKGQELMINARVSSTIAQVRAYRAAVITFRDTYSGLPGDIYNARTILMNCSAATNCFNGNADYIIGTTTGNYSHDNQGGSAALPAVETSMFWKHLADANLISGVDVSADPTIPAWGNTHPDAKIGGGFHVLNTNESGNNQASGHYYILRLNATGDPHPTTTGIEALSANLAFSIDTKIDDGNARNGDVRADDASSNCNIAGIGTYPNNDSKDCLTLFSLE